MTLRSPRKNHLRLVAGNTPPAECKLLDPQYRELIEQLGHDLAAVLIEIADIQDGDPDCEIEIAEDDDPLEDDCA